MVLDRYREASDRSLAPLATAVARVGISANALTAASLVVAIAAAVAFAFADGARPWLLVVGSALVGANALLDALDGRLARQTQTASRRGDYLDHVIDRYADAAILVGLAFSPLVDARWALLALVGTFMTSYMGTQAQALGLGREYRGLLGRADRMFLLISIPIFEAIRMAFGPPLPWGLDLLDLLLVYFAVMGNLTAIQRFRAGWLGLSADPK